MVTDSYLQYLGEYILFADITIYDAHTLHSSVCADGTSCDNFDNCTTDMQNHTVPLPGMTTAPPDSTLVGVAIAAVLGVILLVLLVVCIAMVVVWLMRRRKRTKRDVLGNVYKHTVCT